MILRFRFDSLLKQSGSLDYFYDKQIKATESDGTEKSDFTPELIYHCFPLILRSSNIYGHKACKNLGRPHCHSGSNADLAKEAEVRAPGLYDYDEHKKGINCSYGEINSSLLGRRDHSLWQSGTKENANQRNIEEMIAESRSRRMHMKDTDDDEGGYDDDLDNENDDDDNDDENDDDDDDDDGDGSSDGDGEMTMVMLIMTIVMMM
ncbi:hypothetical protein PoB_000682000 [Plakobranchus ocellatus]|uniref:Uncharacterized protein n=1 Tax=Plakobranchus ocellatus TaxID=259542 RepID=A0AAV3YB94_9GAST|nr:hypothetical protein PoB_000682000 [Plakobranchus ocellatus]